MLHVSAAGPWLQQASRGSKHQQHSGAWSCAGRGSSRRSRLVVEATASGGGQNNTRKSVVARFKSDSPEPLDASATRSAIGFSTAATGLDVGQRVRVTFVVPRHDAHGKTLILCGAAAELGSWVPSKGLVLTCCENHDWTATVDLPLLDALAGFEAKLVCVKDPLVTPKSEAVWEKGENRLVKLPMPFSPVGRYIAKMMFGSPVMFTTAVGSDQPVSCTFKVTGVPVTGSAGGTSLKVKLVGGADTLGNWDVAKGLELQPTGTRGTYSVQASLHPGVAVGCKLACVADGCEEDPIWEDGLDRLVQVAPDAASLNVAMAWREPARPVSVARSVSPPPIRLRARSPAAPKVARAWRGASPKPAKPAPAPAPKAAPAPYKAPVKPAYFPSAPAPVAVMAGPLTLVKFVVPKFEMEDGEFVMLVGGHPELGSWDATRALPLEWCEGGTWVGAAALPSGIPIECKLLVASKRPLPAHKRGSKLRSPTGSWGSADSGDSGDLNYELVQNWERGDNRVIKLAPGVTNLAEFEFNDTQNVPVSHDSVRVEFLVPHGKAIPAGSWLAVLGAHDALGAWDESRALKLKWTYGCNWVGNVTLPMSLVGPDGPGAKIRLLVAHAAVEGVVPEQPPTWEDPSGGMRVIKALDPGAAQITAQFKWGNVADTRLFAVNCTLTPEVPAADAPTPSTAAAPDAAWSAPAPAIPAPVVAAPAYVAPAYVAPAVPVAAKAKPAKASKPVAATRNPVTPSNTFSAISAGAGVANIGGDPFAPAGAVLGSNDFMSGHFSIEIEQDEPVQAEFVKSRLADTLPSLHEDAAALAAETAAVLDAAQEGYAATADFFDTPANNIVSLKRNASPNPGDNGSTSGGAGRRRTSRTPAAGAATSVLSEQEAAPAKKAVTRKRRAKGGASPEEASPPAAVLGAAAAAADSNLALDSALAALQAASVALEASLNDTQELPMPPIGSIPSDGAFSLMEDAQAARYGSIIAGSGSAESDVNIFDIDLLIDLASDVIAAPRQSGLE